MGMFDGFFQNAGNAIHSAGQAVGNVASGLAQTVAPIPGEMADVVAAPFQSVISSARIQMDPQARAQLNAIRTNPKLSEDQKIALSNQLGQKYGDASPQQTANAQRGAELGMGMTAPSTGAGFISDAAPFIKPAMGQASNAASQATKQVVNDFTGPNAQAGFIRIPGGEDPEAIAGPILDKNGAPIQTPRSESQPTAMGSYNYNDNTGAMTPKTPEPAQYATTPPETPAQPAMQPTTPKFQNGEEAVTPPPPAAPTRTFPVDESNPSNTELIENQKRNIQIDGHDVQSPNDVAQVNSTLNGYGIKGPLTKQLQMVKDTISGLANRAQNLVATQGGTVPKLPVVQAIVKNLTYSAKGNIPSNQALKAANDYVDNLYARAMGKDVTQNIEGLTPAQIPGSVLQKMKTFANSDAQSTFGIEDPTKWNPQQTLSRFARDAVDTILDSYYPDASKLNNDMSDLYRAQDSLVRGANIESKAAQTSANAPKNPLNLGDKLMGGLGKQVFPLNLVAGGINVATNSSKGLKIAGATVGTAGLLGLGVAGDRAIQSYNNDRTSQAQNNVGQIQNGKLGVVGNHSSTITQLGSNSNDGYLHTSDLPKSQDSVRLNSDGTVMVASPSQIKDASGATIGIDKNSLKKQVNYLTDQNNQQEKIIEANSTNDYIKQQAGAVIRQNKNTMDALNAAYDPKLNDAYDYANLITGQTAQAIHTLEQSSPNISDLNGYIDDLQNNLSPRYAGLKQQLGVIAKEANGGNLNVKTKESLASVLKEINQQTAWAYYNGINSYIGGVGGADDTTGSPPSVANYAPQAPSAPAQPQTIDFSGLKSNDPQGIQFSNGAPAMQ